MINFTLSYLCTGVILSIIAVVVYYKNRGSEVNKIFSIYSLSVAWWSLCSVFMINAPDAKTGLFWDRVCLIGVIFIPSTFLHFNIHFLSLKGKFYKNVIKVCYTISLFFYTINLSPFFVEKVEPKYAAKFFTVATPIYGVFIFYFFLATVYGIYLIFQKLKATPSTSWDKQRYLYLFWATLLGYTGGGLNYNLSFNIPPYQIVPFGNYLTTIYSMVIAYAIVKHRLLDIRLAVTRASIFTFVYMFVLGIPFAVGWLGSNEISKWLGSKWWLFPTGLMFLLASLGPLIYSRLKHQAEEALLKEQRRYQQTLLRASQGMTFIKELDRLLKLIVHVLTKTIGLEYAAIYIYDKSSSKFQLKAKRGNSFDGFTVIEPRNPLLPFALYHKKAITFETIDEFTANQTKFDADTLKKEMKALSASVLVPSIVENHLLGFSILGEKLSHKPYTEDDLDAFTILANHASLAIENALFYEEAGKTMAEKFHEHRLWSIGRMGSGVGHQINNRFNVISVRSDATRLIEVEKLKKTNLTKDQKQLVDAIESTFVSLTDEAMRGGEIATTLTTFSRKTSDYTDIAFNDVVKGAANLLSCKFNLNELGLVQNYGEFSQKIYGNLSQLQDVFVNLLDNTRDAINKRIEEETAGNIKPKIPNQPPMTEVNAHIEGNKWHIVLQDNGIGMTPDEQKQLFVPFFTTKATAKKGTGLGLSIIKQIIEAHNGTITIDSVYGEGTTFNITLPVYDAQAKKS